MRSRNPSLCRSDGFTLVELMIVVACIALLAALGRTNIQRFNAKAKQAEVRTNISAIAALQETYFDNNENYWDGWGVWGQDLTPIGFKAGASARYAYSTCAYPGHGCSSGTGVDGYIIGTFAVDPNTILPNCAIDSWWYLSWVKSIYPCPIGGCNGNTVVGDCTVNP